MNRRRSADLVAAPTSRRAVWQHPVRGSTVSINAGPVALLQRLGAFGSVICAIATLCSCTTAAKPAVGMPAEVHAVCPPNQVVAWGDSLTYALTKIDGAWQQARPTWVDTIGTKLGVPTKNFGVPSQGSAEIAVRQGGLKPRVTLSGNRIPAKSTAPIGVESISPVDGWSQYSDAGTLKMHGRLAEVPGTLQHTLRQDTENFSFVPDAATDEAVSIPAGAMFSGDEGVQYRDCFQIIWAGNNNWAQQSAIVRDVASMVAFLPSSQRYLIVGTVPAVGDALTRAYGPRFVNLGGWLLTNGLSAAGVLPTAADKAAVEAGTVPPSLTVDGTHFTQAVYTAVGNYFASLIRKALG